MNARRWLSENSLAALCVLAGAVLLTSLSERVFTNNGLGFDGASYGLIITNLEGLRDGSISIGPDLYFRMVPALAVRSVMLAVGAPLTVPNVIVAFQILNVALLTGTAWVWGRTLDVAGVSGRGKWLGYLGLFGNYAVLKYNFYYPVLLDTASLACAALLAWLYLERQTLWLLVAGLVAFFVGPNVGLLAFLLFLGPADPPGADPGAPWPWAVATCCGALVSAAAGLILAPVIPGMADPRAGTLAAAVSLGFLGGGVCCLARFAVPRPGAAGRAMLLRLGLMAGVVALLTLLPMIWPALPSRNWPALFLQYVRTVLINSTARPGEFLVAHALYFGPMFLVVVCLFPAVCREARRLGSGWLLVLAFGLLQSLNPLSRQMIGIIVFLLPPACLALARTCRLPGSFLWGMTLVSLAVSKVWLSINAGAAPTQSIESQPAVWARYLSSTGCWMTTADYRQQGVIAAFGFVVLAVVLTRLRRAA